MKGLTRYIFGAILILCSSIIWLVAGTAAMVSAYGWTIFVWIVGLWLVGCAIIYGPLVFQVRRELRKTMADATKE